MTLLDVTVRTDTNGVQSRGCQGVCGACGYPLNVCNCLGRLPAGDAGCCV